MVSRRGESRLGCLIVLLILAVAAYFADLPSNGTDPVYEKVTQGFFRDSERRLSHYSAAPSVVVVRRFNLGTPNELFVDDAGPAPSNNSAAVQPVVAS